MDLDYDVQEIEEDSGSKFPKWVYILIKFVIGLILIIIGLIILFQIKNLVAWIADINYVPSESELDKPQEVPKIFEVERPFDVTIVEDWNGYNKMVKVVVPKVILAYDPQNRELPTIINTKEPNIERIIRESLSEQKITDLINSKTREKVVVDDILENLNAYLVGVEIPSRESTGKKVRPGTKVELLSTSFKDYTYGIEKNYIKIIDLSTLNEGWIPLEAVEVNRIDKYNNLLIKTTSKVLEKLELKINNEKERENSSKKIERGDTVDIIDIYFSGENEYIQTNYVKVKQREKDIEGWIALDALEEPDKLLNGEIYEVKKEANIYKSNKRGGFVSSGIIDIYFPKGFKILPLN